MRKFCLFVLMSCLLYSCMKHDDFNGDYRDLEAVNHAESVFGIRFMSGHDWSSTNS